MHCPPVCCAQVSYVDAPRFAFRGAMTDVARNFHTKDAVLRLLDAMAMVWAHAMCMLVL